MATARLIDARWALHGKEPGQTEDYRLLAESAGAGLAGDVVQLIPGTPSAAGPGEPSALPWVTIGGQVDKDGLRRVAIAIFEWPEPARLDHFRRPTALTRYYQFDLKQAEVAGAGYQTLYDAVCDVPLPPEERVTGSVAATDLAALTGRVEKYGFDWLLRVAALLIDGPVVVVGAVPVELSERLGLLDAIAALLPYGFRADLTAGSWVPEHGRRKIRLGFGAETGAPSEVRLDRAPATHGASETAQQYQRRVVELQRRWDTARVVRGLWELTQPRDFHRPAGALEALSHLDLPYAVAADVRAGRASVDDVVNVFSSCQLDTYEDDVRDTLLRALLRLGRDEDLALVRPYWSDAVRGLLVDEAARGRDLDRALACAAVSDAAGDLEPFLAELCRRAVLTPDGPATPAVVTTLAVREPPAPGQWATVWHAISASPAVGLRLLVDATDQPVNTVGEWIAWLVDGPDQPTDWMLAMAPARDGSPFTAAHAHTWQTLGPYALHAALKVALAQGRAADIVSPIWPGLLGVPESPYRAATREVLLAMPPMPLGRRGRYDILVVQYGGRPALAPSALSEADRHSYLDGLLRYLRLFRAGAGIVLGQLTEAELNRGLRPIETGRAIVRYLIELANLVGPELRLTVLSRLAAAAADVPESIDNLPNSVTTELFALSAQLRQIRALDEVRASARTDADPDSLAKAWVGAATAGLGAERIADAVSGWPGGDDWRRISQLVNAVEAQTQRRHDDTERALESYLECVELVLSGRLGTVAGQYREVLMARSASARRRWDRVDRLLKNTKQRRFRSGEQARG